MERLSVMRKHAPLLIIMLTGAVARSVYLAQISEYPSFAIPFAGLDEELNHLLAEQISSGEPLPDRDGYHLPLPLYAYFLGTLYSLFGDSFWTGRLANLVLGTCNIGLMYLMASRAFRREGIALVAALGVSLYGPFVVFDTSLYKTSLEVFLLGLSMLLIAKAHEMTSRRWWLLPGLSLGLLASVQGQTSILIGVVCLYILVGPLTLKEKPHLSSPYRRLARFGLFAAGVVLSIFPFAARDFHATHDPVIGGSLAGLNLYIGNHKGAWGGFSYIEDVRPNPAGHYFDAKRVAERDMGRPLDAREVSRYWMRKTVAYISEEPADFARLIREKVRLVLSFYELNDYAYLKSLSSFLACLPGIWLLLPLGMTGALMAVEDFRKLWFIYAGLFSVAAGMLVTFVTWRYRIPFTYLLWPFAGFCLVRAADIVRDRRAAQLLVLSLLVSLFGFLGRAHPVEKMRHDRDMHKNAVNMASSRKESDIRLRLLSGNITADEKSRLWLQLALLRYEMTDTEGAIGILRQALAEYPANERLRTTLTLMIEKPVNLLPDSAAGQ